MAALNRTDAEERAREWVTGAAPGAEPVLHEFDLGWVISARYPVTSPDRLGVPSMVLDRESGALVVGGTLPPESIAEWYARGFRPPPQPEPAGPVPRQFPATMSRLTVADRSWVARSRRSDTDRIVHPIVSTFFEAMPATYAERGAVRSAEAAVFSEFFLAEEVARHEAGRPPLALADARELVRGARLETFRITEDADPSSGTIVRSSLPVLLFLDFLGLSPEAAATGD
ncbi:YwqJ-related putative deaminase [Cryptosporangium aurantiacum]|uniref:Uncharacterized protein n=1 Tax=Cryptosporangium aurantiacum TaxID=134849 RepID=A0A1M7TXM7_9ACTN|nr:YwqJ-related putative deaminase [Cryptosporangium aurantiacum]SHN75393.1 hypothetical protein SAMN05443668_107286 [Cryptosporangium aurantiacum]